MSVSEWYRVTLRDDGFELDVRPPRMEAWTATVRWGDVVRVCLKPEPLELSDGLYIFVRGRPESYVVPTEATGGGELLFALADHGLFKHELIIAASSEHDGLFCWPPPEVEVE